MKVPQKNLDFEKHLQLFQEIKSLIRRIKNKNPYFIMKI